jgi:hypothetical protein
MGKGSNNSCAQAMPALQSFELPGSRKGETFSLVQGVLDDQAKFAFTRGHCHSLALAVHQQTGWPMMAIVGNEKQAVTHVVVAMPDGRWLDAFGPCPAEARRGYHAEEFDQEQIQELGKHKHWLPTDAETAASFVAPLLATL